MIDSLWPEQLTDLSDEQLLSLYEPPPGPWLRMNFVSSLDGAATRDGRAGGLGGEADLRVFELLRWWADAILVGAGTVRIEGYDAMRLPAAAERWRVRRGLSPQPVFVLASRSLDLDPDSALFREAPVRPIVLTAASTPREHRARLLPVAEVIEAGASGVDPMTAREQLHRRGLARIHSEGGPSLFGDFLAAAAVDELCLTLAPGLDAGHAPRIAHGPASAEGAMELAGVLRAGDELLLRYTARSAGRLPCSHGASAFPS